MAGERRSGRVGAAAATLVQLAGMGAGAITSLVIARKLGADGTGHYAVAGQFVLSAMIVGGLGLRTGIAYEISSGRLSPRAAATQATVMAAVFGSLAAAIAFGLYELGSDSVFEGIDEGVAVALVACVPFAVAWWILAAIPLAQEDYTSFAALQAGGFIAAGAIAIPLTIAAGLNGALFGFAAANVVSGIGSVIWALRRTAGEPTGGWQLADSIRVGVRGWSLEMLQLLWLRPDILIVAAFGTAADAGVYSLAVTITTVGWVLPQALSTVALPRVAASAAAAVGEATARPGADPSPVAARAVRQGAVLSVLAGVLVAGLLMLAPLIFGDDFDRTVKLGLIMLPGVIALALGRVMIALLLGLGRASSVLAVGAAVVPAALLAYLLAVPDGGPTAAAIVSCAAYLLTTAGAAIALRRAGLRLGPSALAPRRGDFA